MNNIIYHHDRKVADTKGTSVAGGCLNPFDIRSYKQQININSRFRNNYTTTPATDLFFNLSTPIKKAISMKLICINLPNMVYTVNYKTGSDNFYIYQDPSSAHIHVPSGSYSGAGLATEVTSLLKNDPPFFDVSLNYNPINGLMTFSSGKAFDISFDYVEPCSSTPTGHCDVSFCQNDHIYSQVGSNVFKDQMTLGWILGFRQDYQYNRPITAVQQNVINNLNSTPYVSRKELRNLHNIRDRRPRLTQVKNNGEQYLEKNYNCCDASGFMMYPSPLDIAFSYANKKSYTAEGIYDPLGNRYFLLSVNDFQNNRTRTVVSPMQEETLNDGHLLAKIPAGCCGNNGCPYDKRIYFGPTDIARLHIRLLDEFGRVVDLNNGDYSLTLEFDVLYDL